VSPPQHIDSIIPGPNDILLIAEVSDTTLVFDTQRKGRIYARAEFPEYLVLDLNQGELLVHRAPRHGVYTEIRVLRPRDSFTPHSAPDSRITVAELFAHEL
jgi:Uma2 family endonuclease